MRTRPSGTHRVLEAPVPAKGVAAMPGGPSGVKAVPDIATAVLSELKCGKVRSHVSVGV